MKRKFLTVAVIVSAFFLSSCQEDTTMDELILDTEMTTDGTETGSGTGSGGDGSGGNGDGGVGGNIGG